MLMSDRLCEFDIKIKHAICATRFVFAELLAMSGGMPPYTYACLSSWGRIHVDFVSRFSFVRIIWYSRRPFLSFYRRSSRD